MSADPTKVPSAEEHVDKLMDADDCDTPFQGMLKLVHARDAAIVEKACRAVRENCEQCSGTGIEPGSGGSVADHGCGGDEKLCVSLCPVERQVEPDECQYCGIPLKMIRAAFPEVSE